MNDTEIAMCFGKVCYLSYPDAKAVIKRRLKANRKRSFKQFKDERMNAYRCRTCNRWHIGNSAKQSGQNFRNGLVKGGGFKERLSKLRIEV